MSQGWDGLVSINDTVFGVEGADFGKKGSILERAGMRGTPQHNVDDTAAGPYGVNGSIPVQPSSAELDALIDLVLGTDDVLSAVTIKTDRSTGVFTYPTCCIDKLTVAGSQGGLITATVEPVGTTESATGSVAAPSSAAPLTFADVDLVIGAVTCKPQSIEFKIDRALDRGRFLNSNTLTLNAGSTMDATDKIVTLKAVVPYDSDHSSLYDIAHAGVAGTLTIGTVVLTFGNLKAPAESVPLRKGELYLTLNMQAYRTGSTADVAISTGSGA